MLNLAVVTLPAIIATLSIVVYVYDLPSYLYAGLVSLLAILWLLDRRRLNRPHRFASQLDELTETGEKLGQLIEQAIRPEFNHIANESDKLRYVVSDSVQQLFVVFKTMNEHLRQQHTFIKNVLHDIDSSNDECSEQITGMWELSQATSNILSELIELVVKTSQQNMDMVYQLEDATVSIHSIFNKLDRLDDATEKTGLLAFNAAIEAARIGIKCRDFAEAADEMRNMATSSRKLSADVRSEVTTATDRILMTRDVMQDIASRDMKASIEVKGRVNELLTRINELDHRFEENIKSLNLVDSAMNDTMTEAIMALQFEDITNQVTKHIESRMNWLNQCVDTLNVCAVPQFEGSQALAMINTKVDELLMARNQDNAADNSPLKKKGDGGTIDMF
ncbi:MAG: methyl-accepting chemotaxis protein [Gammaproteobacteria bacterium]|nr:methyl-accepting chemotaxis protein [Gammaproteobacteria bacterium]